jgi:hypothetical protein
MRVRAGSIMTGGGGMKGYKDAPADWEDQVKHFFGVEKSRQSVRLFGMHRQCAAVRRRLLPFPALHGALC